MKTGYEMRILEVIVLGFMLMSIPVSVLGTPYDDAAVATQEGGDVDETSMPWKKGDIG